MEIEKNTKKILIISMMIILVFGIMIVYQKNDNKTSDIIIDGGIIDDAIIYDNIISDIKNDFEDIKFKDVEISENETEEKFDNPIDDSLSLKEVCYIYLDNKTNSCGKFSGGSSISLSEKPTEVPIPEFPVTMIPLFVGVMSIYMRKLKLK